MSSSAHLDVRCTRAIIHQSQCIFLTNSSSFCAWLRFPPLGPESDRRKRDEQAWMSVVSFPERTGFIYGGDDDADKRAADAARRNGGPGIKPGGVRKHKSATVDVQRVLAEESVCLRDFYEGLAGDGWIEHSSWQKLLVQLRMPDGSPIELDRIASMTATEMDHFRDEILGVKARWVNRRVYPKDLLRVVELILPSNNLIGRIPDCTSVLVHLRHVNLSENRLTGLLFKSFDWDIDF